MYRCDNDGQTTHNGVLMSLVWRHFIWTECTVIGQSHGKLGQALWNDSVTAHWVQLKWVAVEMKWGEMRCVSATLHKKMSWEPRVSQSTVGWSSVWNRWNSLDQETVDVGSINSFKGRLDKIRKTRMCFLWILHGPQSPRPHGNGTPVWPHKVSYKVSLECLFCL